MARDAASPLLEEQRARFSGLSYFLPDPSVVYVVTLEGFAERQEMQLTTSSGDLEPYIRAGAVELSLPGGPVRLTIFESIRDGTLFLPFGDATNGRETYGAGRYLEPERLPDGSILIDFNRAYNPFCAYNDRWRCPMPPAENRLRLPIRAGERAFPDKAARRSSDPPEGQVEGDGT